MISDNRNKGKKPNKMKRAHIHGLSSYTYCVLIYLILNDKSIDTKV